jgi:hypothetical protein
MKLEARNKTSVDNTILKNKNAYRKDKQNWRNLKRITYFINDTKKLSCLTKLTNDNAEVKEYETYMKEPAKGGRNLNLKKNKNQIHYRQ